MQTALEKPKRPVGPPTKYTQEFLDKAHDYVENYRDYGDKIPSIAGLAQVTDVTRERIHVWKAQRNKSELNHILTCIQQAQERALLNNGLDGTFNSAITKLVLSKHGYTENNQANQGNTGIQVIVNRDTVTVNTGDAVQDEVRRERVIEHE